MKVQLKRQHLHMHSKKLVGPSTRKESRPVVILCASLMPVITQIKYQTTEAIVPQKGIIPRGDVAPCE